MRLLPFGSSLMLVPVLLSSSACGDGDLVRKSSPDAAGTGGAQSAGASAGGNPTAGGAPMGGNTPQGGDPNDDGGGAAGAPSGDAGAGGANSSGECGDPSGLSIVGDYVDPNGERWWLRDSGKAVTLSRVPAGKPTASKPPALSQVVRACSVSSDLLLKTPSGSFTRLDYLAGAKSLTVCLASSTVATPALAAALPAADRANTIDSGCNAGPWLRVVKEEK